MVIFPYKKQLAKNAICGFVSVIKLPYSLAYFLANVALVSLIIRCRLYKFLYLLPKTCKNWQK
ncbi:hypothetical protein B0189_09395 [Moraxella cuniculi]|nr:hypothetical protein B0189_09395 [Moraxella cuniculi]